MKKLLTLVALLGAASLTYGQGTVSFANTSATRVGTNIVHNTASTGLTAALGVNPPGYYYTLLYDSNTNHTSVDASFTGWTSSGVIGTNGALGRLSGNPGTDPATINGVGVGATANLLVVGWSANIGGTYAQALTWWNNGNPNTIEGWFGFSSAAVGMVLGGGTSPAAVPFGPNPGQIATGFLLNEYAPVPEPSTFALAGLGAAAMMIFRRRK